MPRTVFGKRRPCDPMEVSLDVTDMGKAWSKKTMSGMSVIAFDTKNGCMDGCIPICVVVVRISNHMEH